LPHNADKLQDQEEEQGEPLVTVHMPATVTTWRRTMARTSQSTPRGSSRKIQPARGGEARLPTPSPGDGDTLRPGSSPMKNIEERRPVMFMCWEVQEKAVPNCQDTKKPMMATPM